MTFRRRCRRSCTRRSRSIQGKPLGWPHCAAMMPCGNLLPAGWCCWQLYHEISGRSQTAALGRRPVRNQLPTNAGAACGWHLQHGALVRHQTPFGLQHLHHGARLQHWGT